MGTRADFYLKNDDNLEWLGSIAFDGYDIDDVSKASTKTEFKKLLKDFLDNRDDSTYPENGWPWPWNNSKLTDEIYVFVNDIRDGFNRIVGYGEVWRAFNRGGCDYRDHTEPLNFAPVNEMPKFNDEKDEYETPTRSMEMCVPDMSNLKNVTLGKKSGLIVLRGA